MSRFTKTRISATCIRIAKRQKMQYCRGRADLSIALEGQCEEKARFLRSRIATVDTVSACCPLSEVSNDIKDTKNTVSGDNFIQYKTVRTLWRLELETTEIWISYFRLLSLGNWVVLVMHEQLEKKQHNTLLQRCTA
ncbi:hypothetical protein EYC84_008387 [Monilinia fructicola]|uniref:Uncharacterized protein n=1 Tax=Monilinia fructicola TaxID=38448 RepID=A0A5M9JJP4_MONFR|nr:hypothetical protein EYC84_008387 [Monilinia fructicola]